MQPKKIIVLFFVCLLGFFSAVNASADTTSADLQLPKSTQAIEDEAFYGDTSLNTVTVPEGALTIGARAFAYSSLTEIKLPASLISIAEDAFEGCGDFLAVVYKNSPAHQWCEQHSIRYRFFNDTPVVYRALLIGNTYEGSDIALVSSDDDIAAMKKMLSLQTATPYVITIKLNLSASEMLSAITSAFAEADDNDVSLFFYSGHGVESDYTPYVGALYGEDRSVLTVAQLRTQLDTIPGEKIVLLDSCYSGAHISKSTASGSAKKFNDSVISAFSTQSKTNLASNHYTVLTACSASETSWCSSYSNGYGYSWFTHGVTSGSGYDMINQSYCSMSADEQGNRNNSTSLREVYNYASAIVQSLYQERVEVAPFITPQNIQYYGNLDYTLWAYHQPFTPPTATPTPIPTAVPTSVPTAVPTLSLTAAPTSTPLPDSNPVIYRALLVGNTYEGSDSPLASSDDDAAAIRKMLSLQSNTPYSFTTKLNASASEILSAITTTFAGADDNDVSLFFYSGHGVESDYTPYVGALYGEDGSLLTVDQLRTQLDTIPGQKIVLLDSCYSGAHISKSAASGSAKSFNDSVISAFSTQSKANLASNRYIVLTACSASEVSWSSSYENGYGYSWFTHGITSGSGYDMINQSYCDMYADKLGNHDKNVSLYEAYTFAYDTVMSIYQERKEFNPSVTLQNVQYYGNPNCILWAYDDYFVPTPTAAPTPTPTPKPTPTPTPKPTITPTPQFSYTKAPDLTIIITGVQPTSAEHLVIPPALSGRSVSAIKEGAFRDMAQLESVEFPISVSSIGNEVFRNCPSLTQVTLHPFIKELGNDIFDGCDQLVVTVYEGTLGETYCQENNYRYTSLPNPYEGVVLEGTRMIKYTGTAKKLIIPEGVTEVITDCFIDADTLEEIIFPDSLQKIEEFIFGWMISLKRVELKGSLTFIPDYTFCAITSLEEVVLPDTIREIGEGAFCQCTHLHTINMPKALVTIGDEAFCHCPSLKEVVLPHGVQTIGNYAFNIWEHWLEDEDLSHLNGRYGLDRIFIPKTVTSIGDHALDWNRNLVVEVEANSHALSYCKSFKIPYKIVSVTQ